MLAHSHLDPPTLPRVLMLMLSGVGAGRGSRCSAHGEGSMASIRRLLSDLPRASQLGRLAVAEEVGGVSCSAQAHSAAAPPGEEARDATCPACAGAPSNVGTGAKAKNGSSCRTRSRMSRGSKESAHSLRFDMQSSSRTVARNTLGKCACTSGLQESGFSTSAGAWRSSSCASWRSGAKCTACSREVVNSSGPVRTTRTRFWCAAW
mmetsp:Transcript_35309/g.81771  ORF Transcript_35309/g.81771 Transcript_35309/m.81771 type:complete len:206 (-) Transcript_35309:697-1314(-)